MASYIYGSYKQGVLAGGTGFPVDFDTDEIHVALVNSAYVANASAQDVHNYFDDVGASEVSGASYVSGGQSLLSKVVTQDTGNDRSDWDAADTLWSNSTITAYGAVVYKKVLSTTSASPLIALIDFGGVQVSSSGSFTIAWSSVGILRLA